MSEKVTYVICVVLFIALVALIICERQNPEGGMVLLQSLFQ